MTSVADDAFAQNAKVNIAVAYTGYQDQQTYPSEGNYPVDDTISAVAYTWGNIANDTLQLPVPRKYGYDYVWTVGGVASEQNTVPVIKIYDVLNNKAKRSGDISRTAKTWPASVTKRPDNGSTDVTVRTEFSKLTFGETIPDADILTRLGYEAPTISYDQGLVAGMPLTTELEGTVTVNSSWTPESYSISIGGNSVTVTFDEKWNTYLFSSDSAKYTFGTATTATESSFIDLNSTVDTTVAGKTISKYYKITFTSGTGGSVSGSGYYKVGVTPNPVITPKDGYEFANWSLQAEPVTGGGKLILLRGNSSLLHIM